MVLSGRHFLLPTNHLDSTLNIDNLNMPPKRFQNKNLELHPAGEFYAVLRAASGRTEFYAVVAASKCMSYTLLSVCYVSISLKKSGKFRLSMFNVESRWSVGKRKCLPHRTTICKFSNTFFYKFRVCKSSIDWVILWLLFNICSN